MGPRFTVSVVDVPAFCTFTLPYTGQSSTEPAFLNTSVLAVPLMLVMPPNAPMRTTSSAVCDVPFKFT